MNNTLSKSFLQENVCENPIQSAQQRRELLKSNPAQVVRGFSLATRQVYDYLVRVSAYHQKVYLSHDRIGQIVRKSRRQVIRVLKTLREWGLISWHTPERNWKNHLANEYFVDPIVRDLKFRKGAGYWIWGLRVLPLVLLVSSITLSKARAGRDVTPIKNIDKYQSVSETVIDSLSISKESVVKRVTGTELTAEKKNQHGEYRIRYTKVREGLTKAERRSMLIEQMVENVKLITTVKLSAVGRIHFSPYHAEAIKEANRKLAAAKGKISNPIGYLKSQCIAWHKQNNMDPDFSVADDLFEQNPDWRNLPIYEDDGRVHKSTVSLGTDSELTEKRKNIAREFGIDPEAQVQYQPNQSRQSSVVGDSQKGVNRTSPHSVYTKYQPQQLPEEGLDETKRKTIEHFKTQWDSLPPFTKELIGIVEGTHRVTPLPQDKAIGEHIKGVKSVEEVLASFAFLRSPAPAVETAPTPSPLSAAQLPYESDDAPFFEPQTNDDQLYEEIDGGVSY